VKKRKPARAAIDFAAMEAISNRRRALLRAAYRGDLARPMRRLRSMDPILITQFLKEPTRRMVLLFEHFELVPGDWKALAYLLAAKHVPGMQQTKAGRKRNYNRALELAQRKLDRLELGLPARGPGRPTDLTQERDRLTLRELDRGVATLRRDGLAKPSLLAVARFEFVSQHGTGSLHRVPTKRWIRNRAAQFYRARDRSAKSR